VSRTVRRRWTFLALLVPSTLLAAAGCASSRVESPRAEKPARERATASPSSRATPAANVKAKPARSAGRRSVADVMATLGADAERRLRAKFAANDVAYPPRSVYLLAFKQERRIDVWAEGGGGYRFAASYPLTDTSGELGPKLRQGDYQIPEGVYRVTWLHPNSQYHLSLKLDYPNEFDRARAAEEGRTNLGGDIFIHGDEHSIGCLAVGDPAIEELFALAARVGREQMTVVIAPWDLRRRPAPPSATHPSWLPTLYAELSQTLARFAPPAS
jgi:hypothetical protein